MTDFFIPFTPSDEAEAVYESLTRIAGLSIVPGPGERVSSLVFMQHGEAWMAQVGQRLWGRLHGQAMTDGISIAREYEAGDAALVLAIFQNDPGFIVLTDNGRTQRALSRFSSPFTVSRAVGVVRFAHHGAALAPRLQLASA